MHLKETDLIQNRETMTVQNLTTLIYYNSLCMLMKYHLVESLVVYIFSEHTVAHDHMKLSSNILWYGLQMSFNGPHNFMVTALGHTVKWPGCSVFQ
jgi:hypothetical protein